MSSSGGVGSGGGNFKISEQGIDVGGDVPLDPSQNGVLEKFVENMSPAEVAAVMEALQEVGFTVKRRRHKTGDSFAVAKTGIIDVTGDAEDDELDIDLIDNVYVFNGWMHPSANSRRGTHKTVSREKGFKDSVDLVKNYFENPTAENKAAFMKQFLAYTAERPNVHDVLFLIMKEGVRETNEDKKYFLLKMKDMNKIADEMANKLQDFMTAGQTLTNKGKDMDSTEAAKEKTSVQKTTFDAGTLKANGEVSRTDTTISVDRTSLNNAIKHLESQQETLKNKRSIAQTSFQNFDQKSNQLYNLISTVMKSMNEMRQGTIRNML